MCVALVSVFLVVLVFLGGDGSVDGGDDGDYGCDCDGSRCGVGCLDDSGGNGGGDDCECDGSFVSSGGDSGIFGDVFDVFAV